MKWPEGTLLIENVSIHLKSPRSLASVLTHSKEIRNSRETERGQSGLRNAVVSVFVF